MGLIKSNIRFLRKQKGLTHEGLANSINVTRSVIGAYEEGRAEPKIRTMQAMANSRNRNFRSRSFGFTAWSKRFRRRSEATFWIWRLPRTAAHQARPMSAGISKKA